eukprot:10451198-Heterocapsa_arctica.AAC.1
MAVRLRAHPERWRAHHLLRLRRRPHHAKTEGRAACPRGPSREYRDVGPSRAAQVPRLLPQHRRDDHHSVRM